MGQAIPTRQSTVVLRSHFNHLRALLAVALIAVAGLTVAVVILATDSNEVRSTSSARPIESINYGSGVAASSCPPLSRTSLRPPATTAARRRAPPTSLRPRPRPAPARTEVPRKARTSADQVPRTNSCSCNREGGNRLPLGRSRTDGPVRAHMREGGRSRPLSLVRLSADEPGTSRRRHGRRRRHRRRHRHPSQGESRTPGSAGSGAAA